MAERFDRRAFLARVLYGATAAWIAPSLNSLPVGALERLALPGAAAQLAARRTILAEKGTYYWWMRSHHAAQPEGLVLSPAGHRYYDIDTEALRVEAGSYCLRYRLGTCEFFEKPKSPTSVRVSVAGATQVHSVTGYGDHLEDFALAFTVSEPTDLTITVEPPDGPEVFDPTLPPELVELAQMAEGRWCAFVEDVTLEQTSTSVIGPPMPCEPIAGGRQLRPNTPLDRFRDDGVLLKRPDDGVCLLSRRSRVDTMQPDTPEPERFDAVWELDLEPGPYRLGYRLGGYNNNRIIGRMESTDSRTVVNATAGHEVRTHDLDLDDPVEEHALLFIARALPVAVRFEVDGRCNHPVVIDDVSVRPLV